MAPPQAHLSLRASLMGTLLDWPDFNSSSKKEENRQTTFGQNVAWDDLPSDSPRNRTEPPERRQRAALPTEAPYKGSGELLPACRALVWVLQVLYCFNRLSERVQERKLT